MVHKILYVDDEAGLRHVVKAYLESFIPSAEVTAVSSGRGFLEELANKGHSAVTEGGYSIGVVDIELHGEKPAMDGFRVAERVRETPGISGIPLILYSANDMMVEDARSRGFESVSKTNLAGLVRKVSEKL